MAQLQYHCGSRLLLYH